MAKLARVLAAGLQLLLWPLRAVAAAFAVFAGSTLLLLLLSLPRSHVQLLIDGPSAPVDIAWDEHGVPTIRAANESDAWFALGFVHARDRLWQMELRRRAARGRLAEVLGAEALPMDRLLRTLGLGWRADRAVAAFTPSDRARLEAYARGVNAFVATAPLLPPPFLLLDLRPEAWQPADSIALQKLLALELERDWREELLRARLLAHLGAERFSDLFPPPAADEITTIGRAQEAMLAPFATVFAHLDALLPRFETVAASNAWAVDGTRSRTMRPILASDPHLPLEWPVIWYLVRIETPEFTVTGGSIPGLPAVIIGHSADLAWGITASHADTQDLIGVELAPDGSDREKGDGGWLPLRVREEIIRVRGGQDERLRVRESRYGPLISDLLPYGAHGGAAWALTWPALSEHDTSLAFAFRLLRAKTGEDLAAAAPLFITPVHNLIWAARDGQIGFRVIGQLPWRSHHHGFLPVPPGAPAGFQGTLAPELLPSVTNPVSGMVINANNRPVAGPEAERIARDWPDALRAERIAALLEAFGRTQLFDHARIQLDVNCGLARHFLPHLARLELADPKLERLRQALLAWDGAMTVDRFEPALFSAWYQELQRALYADELGPLFFAWGGVHFRFVRRILEERQQWCDDVRTAIREDCADRLAHAFAHAVDWLERTYARPVENILWGEIHQAEAREPVFGELPWLSGLFALKGPVGGGRTSIAVAAWSDAEPFRAQHVAGLRMLVAFTPEPQSLWMIATGQSGQPHARHARDLFDKWRRGEYIRIGECYERRNCAITRLQPSAPALSNERQRIGATGAVQ